MTVYSLLDDITGTLLVPVSEIKNVPGMLNAYVPPNATLDGACSWAHINFVQDEESDADSPNHAGDALDDVSEDAATQQQRREHMAKFDEMEAKRRRQKAQKQMETKHKIRLLYQEKLRKRYAGDPNIDMVVEGLMADFDERDEEPSTKADFDLTKADFDVEGGLRRKRTSSDGGLGSFDVDVAFDESVCEEVDKGLLYDQQAKLEEWRFFEADAKKLRIQRFVEEENRAWEKSHKPSEKSDGLFRPQLPSWFWHPQHDDVRVWLAPGETPDDVTEYFGEDGEFRLPGEEEENEDEELLAWDREQEKLLRKKIDLAQKKFREKAETLPVGALESPEPIKTIRLYSSTARKVFAKKPMRFARPEGGWTVKALLDCIVQTETAQRKKSEWLGGIDAHHVFFEGLVWDDEAEAYEISWGS